MGRRWLLVGLVVSLALNLFLIGAGAGVLALGLRMARENAAGRPGVLVQATAGLPQPDRRLMRLVLRQAWLDVRPAVQQSRAVRLAGWTALAGPAPDAAAIKADLAQSRQLDIATRGQVEDKVVDYALTLPSSDRLILVQGLRRALPPPAAASPPAANSAKP